MEAYINWTSKHIKGDLANLTLSPSEIASLIKETVKDTRDMFGKNPIPLKTVYHYGEPLKAIDPRYDGRNSIEMQVASLSLNLRERLKMSANINAVEFRGKDKIYNTLHDAGLMPDEVYEYALRRLYESHRYLYKTPLEGCKKYMEQHSIKD